MTSSGRLKSLPCFFGIVFDVLSNAMDQCMFKTFVDIGLSPLQICLFFSFAFTFVAVRNIQEALGRILSPIEKGIFDMLSRGLD